MSSKTLMRSSPGVVSTFTLTLKSLGRWFSSISCLVTEKGSEVGREGWMVVLIGAGTSFCFYGANLPGVAAS